MNKLFPFDTMRSIHVEHGRVFRSFYFDFRKKDAGYYYVFLRPAPNNVIKIESNYDDEIPFTHSMEFSKYLKEIDKQ